MRPVSAPRYPGIAHKYTADACKPSQATSRQPAIQKPRGMSSFSSTGWKLVSKWARMPASHLREGCLVRTCGCWRSTRLRPFPAAAGVPARSVELRSIRWPTCRAIGGDSRALVAPPPFPPHGHIGSPVSPAPAGLDHGAAAEPEPAVCKGRQGGAVSGCHCADALAGVLGLLQRLLACRRRAAMPTSPTCMERTAPANTSCTRYWRCQPVTVLFPPY